MEPAALVALAASVANAGLAVVLAEPAGKRYLAVDSSQNDLTTPELNHN